MLNTPFSPWPSYTLEETDAISRVLLSGKVNYWTGQECREFEKEFADWCGTSHAIALSNGTLALDLALHGLGVGHVNGGSSDDEVIVTPRTFLASVSCVVNAGAVPIFADVDLGSGNLSAATIAPMITPKTKAIIVVHMAGWPADMLPIMALAEAYNIKVIEDCAQAHGARYQGKPVGSISHLAAWSFCQDKIMTTGGEGGMVTTNDAALWSRMWSYKDHGKNWDAVYNRQHAPGFRYVHESFGTNWRMMEMQAVLGRIQLKRMQAWSNCRTENARILADSLSAFTGSKGNVKLPQSKCASCKGCSVETGCAHANYKFYAHIDAGKFASGWTRDRVVEEINALGVPCYHGGSSEVYLEKAFDNTGWRPEERLSNAKLFGETSIMMLLHPTLTGAEMQKAADAVRAVFCAAINLDL
jgi:dTDP-4-amino-4,6-dideoxygalactose transaminase